MIKNYISDNKWYIKALTQLFLSKIPYGETINFNLQKRESEQFKFSTKKRLSELVEYIWSVNQYKKIEGSTVLEIGAGWDLINTVIFSLLGAKKITAYDHVHHARLSAVNIVLNELNSLIPHISKVTEIPTEILSQRLKRMMESSNLEDFFKVANIDYKAPSNISKLSNEDQSIDIVYSYAVLAHPPTVALENYSKETKRVLKNDGIISHYIGLQDPFNNLYKKRNNISFLKYSDKKWKFLAQNSINSNNRVRAKEHIQFLTSKGAKLLKAEADIDNNDIDMLKNIKIDQKFTNLSAQELCAYRLILVATFNQDSKDTSINYKFH